MSSTHKRLRACPRSDRLELNPTPDTGRRMLLRSMAVAATSAGGMLGAGGLLMGSGPASAQSAQSAPGSGAWPQRAIRIIHPWAAGGGGDIVTRVIADRMRLELGVPVLVENRPGAGGNLGAELASRQPPDGYTLMTTAGGFAIAPSLYKNLNYDPVKDFVPVTKIATAPLLVLVRADSPLRSMADLIALAKKDPKGVTFGSFGNGSPSHLIGESINRLAGISMTHVPYTGGGAATDLMGGSLTLAILDAVSQTPQVKAGKLRALALNGNQRLPALPDVPTLIETGIPFDLVGWHAMFAPTGTPREIVERLNQVVNQIIAIPEVKARIFEMGSFPVQPPTTATQWGTMFRQDVQAWGELVRRSGATIN
jgi:tripartite-type tricarboxylate transporter receptor subunit TctC